MPTYNEGGTIASVLANLKQELDGKLTHRKACHKPECRFRDCWNPDHIYVGWPSENVADAIKAGTFRHAVANRGDEFDEEKWREEWIERNKK